MSACVTAGGTALSRAVRASASNQEPDSGRGVKHMSERRNLAVASLLALSLGCAGAASAQEIKLTLADQNSPTAWGPSHALQPWVKQVEEATKGRVKIEVYPSQTLIKGVDMWKGIRSGIADIGWCVQGYWPEQTPLSDVMSLPFLPIKLGREGQRGAVEAVREISLDAEGVRRDPAARAVHQLAQSADVQEAGADARGLQGLEGPRRWAGRRPKWPRRSARCRR